MKVGLKAAFKSFIKRDYKNFHALQNINLEIDKGYEIIEFFSENGAERQL